MDSSSIRFQAFSDALNLAGIAPDSRLVVDCDFTYAHGFQAASALIAEHHPTAIAAGADLIALGAAAAARALGLSVPGEFSVLGCLRPRSPSPG